LAAARRCRAAYTFVYELDAQYAIASAWIVSVLLGL
jgi:hypothetical protein